MISVAPTITLPGDSRLGLDVSDLPLREFLSRHAGRIEVVRLGDEGRHISPALWPKSLQVHPAHFHAQLGRLELAGIKDAPL